LQAVLSATEKDELIDPQLLNKFIGKSHNLNIERVYDLIEDRFNRINNRDAIRYIARDIMIFGNEKSSRLMKGYYKLCKRFEDKLSKEEKELLYECFADNPVFVNFNFN